MRGVCVRYSEINSDGKKNTAKFYPKDNQIVAYDGDVKCTFKKGIFSYEQGKYVIEVTVDDGGIVGGVLKVNGEVRDSFSYQKPRYHSIDLGEKIAKFCSRNKDGATSEIISVFNKDMDTYQEKGDAMFWNRPTRRKISEKLSETVKRKDVAYNGSFSIHENEIADIIKKYKGCRISGFYSQDDQIAVFIPNDVDKYAVRKEILSNGFVLYNASGVEEGVIDEYRKKDGSSFSEKTKRKLTFWF